MLSGHLVGKRVRFRIFEAGGQQFQVAREATFNIFAGLPAPVASNTSSITDMYCEARIFDKGRLLLRPEVEIKGQVPGGPNAPLRGHRAQL